MNTKFDELTKSIAQSVTRRGAVKKFGVGLAGMALACLGLANRAQADGPLCNACMKNCKANGGSPQYCKEQCYLVCHGWNGP